MSADQSFADQSFADQRFADQRFADQSFACHERSLLRFFYLKKIE
jgi:hypothetical protein